MSYFSKFWDTIISIVEVFRIDVTRLLEEQELTDGVDVERKDSSRELLFSSLGFLKKDLISLFIFKEFINQCKIFWYSRIIATSKKMLRELSTYTIRGSTFHTGKELATCEA